MCRSHCPPLVNNCFAFMKFCLTRSLRIRNLSHFTRVSLDLVRNFYSNAAFFSWARRIYNYDEWAWSRNYLSFSPLLCFRWLRMFFLIIVGAWVQLPYILFNRLKDSAYWSLNSRIFSQLFYDMEELSLLRFFLHSIFCLPNLTLIVIRMHSGELSDMYRYFLLNYLSKLGA